MFAKLKSFFGFAKKTNDEVAQSKVDQSVSQVATNEASQTQEYGHQSLEHARELSLSFISSLLGVRAVETEQSKAQEDLLREALDAEITGLSERSIPKLSKSALSLVSDLTSYDTPQSKILTAINEDPALAGKVISIANSPLYIASDTEIKDLDHAVTMIGLVRLKEVVLKSIMADKFELNSYYFETFGKALWEHSSEVAGNAKKIAEQSGLNGNQAYFIGLIHDLGKLIIFKKLVELHSEEGSEPHPQVFSNLLSDYSAALTRRACEVWELPIDWYQPILEFQMAEPGDLKQPESVALFLANLFAELNALFAAGEITEFELIWKLQEVGSSIEEFRELYPEAK